MIPRERWFTTDLHLGHANIIAYCWRPFGSVDDMDAALLAAWEATVSPGDEVWVLGDLALGQVLQALELVSLLPGRKFLVSGNHDRCWAGHHEGVEKWRAEYEAAGFRIVDGLVETSIAGISDPRSGISAAQEVELYVEAQHVQALAEEFLFSDKGTPNVTVHVVSRPLPHLKEAPLGLVIADLADWDRPREDQQARALLRELALR